MFEQAIVVISEVALALYPILIKRVPTDLVTQLLSRFLTFSVLAAVLAKPKAILQTWGTSKGILRSSGLGLITLLHVAVSYYAFKELPAGAAMAIFYTYPIWNVIGGMIGYGETVSPLQIALLLTSFIGVIMVSYSTRSTESTSSGESRIHWKGVAAALAAALTETAMYFGVRTASQADPYYATLELYPGALFGLMALLVAKLPSIGSLSSLDFRPEVWGPMMLFNALIGFVGYVLRFSAIGRVSTIVFSMLSFVGVVASYAWGWFLAGERPTVEGALGAFLIAISSGGVGLLKGGKLCGVENYRLNHPELKRDCDV